MSRDAILVWNGLVTRLVTREPGGLPGGLLTQVVADPAKRAVGDRAYRPEAHVGVARVEAREALVNRLGGGAHEGAA